MRGEPEPPSAHSCPTPCPPRSLGLIHRKGAGTHIGVQEHAGVLHDFRLLLHLEEEGLVLSGAATHGHHAQQQESEDQAWGREGDITCLGEEATGGTLGQLSEGGASEGLRGPIPPFQACAIKGQVPWGMVCT